MEKTASPSHIEVGPNVEVSYTITVYNGSDEEITDGTLVDDYNVGDFTPSVLGGAVHDPVNGTLNWANISAPAGGSFSKDYKGFVVADRDKNVINSVTFTGTNESGEEVSVSTQGVVIVSEPGG